MASTKPARRLDVSGKLDALRDRIGRGLGSIPSVLPLADTEREGLLRIVADPVLRIRLEPDGSVAVAGNRIRFHMAASTVANTAGQPGRGDEPQDPTRAMYEEIARHAEEVFYWVGS